MSIQPKPCPTAIRPGTVHGVRDVSSQLAHDLRTPLAAIAMNLDFATSELGPDLPETLRDALADCREANQRAVSLVADVADALRLASGVLRPRIAAVDVSARVGAAVRRMALEVARRSVRMMWAPDVAIVQADGDLLERVLDKLLEQALRHAHAGDSIDVSLRGDAVVVRVSFGHAGTAPSVEVARQSLAMHFADVAMRAQGGAVWTEAEAGALLLVIALPA
ncbi:MAG TPA: histidine kinase dimerization/phospho-acceptor domain-containing protein [Polyangiaceae bacterium]